MSSIEQLKTELGTAVDRGLALGAKSRTASEDAEFAEIELRAERLATEIRSAERAKSINSIGRTSGFRIETGQASGADLATAILDAGWDRQTHSSVTVDNAAVRLKTGSVDGGVDGTEVADRFIAPPLGLDGRYLFPHVTTQSVAGDETGVTSYRQKSRTLGTPSNMIQAIDYTSAKEETDSEAEVVATSLKMIANVETGTPNILLANQSFRGWVNADLIGAYRAALDYHIVTEIGNAGIGTGGGGQNVFEDILYSQEVVRAAGYDPSLVVMSPADALAVQLLQMSSGVTYAFGQRMPTVVVSPSVSDAEGFVCDPSALGILFLGPFTFATFEEANGTTNCSTVRGESSGLFLVQRPDAAANLAGAS